MHTLEGAPPAFYTTFVRPDPNRKAKVQIVALDARQLELDLAIGAEGPFPPDEKTSGKWPRGGMLPRDARVATHVVAAFNGGFRLDQGNYGMTVDRRVFMPPLRDVASLLMHDDGRLGFGTFGPSMKTPDDVRSLRQNLDPLIDDGVVNPRKRVRWGGIIKAGAQVGQRAKRSGICRTREGDFLYLWGNDIEAMELGSAMKLARCDYGLHLDMNLLHVGFVFMSFDDADYKVGDSEPLSPTMGVTKKKYSKQPNPKEFFYAMLREPVAGPSSTFVPDGMVQPPPAWLPSVLVSNEAGVRITFFDARRVRMRLIGGGAEPTTTAAAPPTTLTGDDAARVLASIRLGVATPTFPLALLLDGALRSPASTAESIGTLWLDEAGHVAIALSGEESHARSATQGRLLIVGGKAVDPPNDLVMAIGVTAKGDLLVADRSGSIAPASRLVEALLRAGCVRAIAPRGEGAGKLERMGRDDVAVGGDETRLFVLANTPPNATYRFDLDEMGAPRWPKVTTPVK